MPELQIGRESLRPYIVSTGTYGLDGLIFKDEDAVKRANSLYEAGTHELCQGREGETIIQYCIPRKRPAKRRRLPWAGPMIDRLAMMLV